MKRLILLLILSSLACGWSGFSSTSYPPKHILTVATLTSSVNATPAFTVSPTLAPYEQYTIDFLRKRTYGGGNIKVTQVMKDDPSFTRYLIRYPSDGLNIYGFANVPKGQGPFPIIIVIHGFVKVSDYQTLDYTTDAADRITQAGYIVVHPNLRNYPPSDNGDNLFRVGMAVDILNLIALIRSGAGPVELLKSSAPNQIGLWGHSVGGEIILRVLTVSSDVKAAVLYSSISGDEIKNAQLLSSISSDPIFQTELNTSPTLLQRISPAYYYKNITTPIQLYHGTADTVVPLAWAQETCNALKDARVQTNCIFYQGEDHTFRSRVSDEFYDTMLNFFKTYLAMP